MSVANKQNAQNEENDLSAMNVFKKFRYLRIFLSAALFCVSTAVAADVAKVDTAARAMVVAAHPEAVLVGVEMLKQGGNAVDAAVATAFMIGVVEPHASGLGGGGAMLIYLKKENGFRYLDYYMQTSLHPDTAFSNKKDLYTPRAICIPGVPSGLITANRLYGKLPLKTVMAPAIKTAREGFVVSEKFYTNILDKLDVISDNPPTQKIFFKDDFPLSVGDTLKNPQLAHVLERLADQGEDYFYRGDFAKQAVMDIQKSGGYLTKQDFAHYRARNREALHTSYGSYQLFSAPPPQSGATLLEILNIWENVLPEKSADFVSCARCTHLLCEAMKRADADRYAYMADPDAFPVPVVGLTAKGFARRRFEDIDPEKMKYTDNNKIPAGNPWFFDKHLKVQENADNREEGPHTTQISVVDARGNAVSLTQTLGHFFGSGFSSQGVVFNSSMANFYSRPSRNRIGSARRPLTTISPTIIMKDGNIFSVLGTPGGGRIFNVMAQIIIRLLDFNSSATEAVNAPRFSIRLRSGKLYVENRFPKSTLKSLSAMGYPIKALDSFTPYFGGVQLIVFDAELKQWIGVSDPRRDGGAAGI